MTGSDDQVFDLLAASVAAAPPAALGEHILQAARRSRPVGRPIDALGGGRQADPAAAFAQTAGEFAAVLAIADGGSIVEPYGWSVTQLVAHLLDIDLYLGRQLDLWQHPIDESLEDDHLAMTESAVRASVRADFADTVSRWRQVSADLCAHITSLDADALQHRINFHMLYARLSTVLVVRVFEIWTHIEDLCRAIRRDAPQLDAARLRMMTEVAVAAIPLGLLLGSIDGGDHTARIVLTGRGGGVWNQPLQVGGAAGEPSVTIVADAIEFCRLAAQRIAPADLDAEVAGPMDLAVDVLRGASVFAA